MQLDLKCCSNLVLNSNIFEMLTPGISNKMGVLDASIATGTDDKLSLIFNTLFEHHVCSHPTSMETHSQGKFLMEIVLIALKQKNQNKCQVQVLKWWSALHRRYTDGRYQCLYTLTRQGIIQFLVIFKKFYEQFGPWIEKTNKIWQKSKQLRGRYSLS